MVWITILYCALWFPPKPGPLWVDRVEGPWVVVIDQDEEDWDIPGICLPPGVQEGDKVGGEALPMPGDLGLWAMPPAFPNHIAAAAPLWYKREPVLTGPGD